MWLILLLNAEHGLAERERRSRVRVVQVKLSEHEDRTRVGRARIKMGGKHLGLQWVRTPDLPA